MALSNLLRRTSTNFFNYSARFFSSGFNTSVENNYNFRKKISNFDASKFPKEVPVCEHNIGRSFTALGDFLCSQVKDSKFEDIFPYYLQAFYNENNQAFQSLMKLNSENNSVVNYCKNIIENNLALKNEAIFWLGNYLKNAGEHVSAKTLFEEGSKNKCHRSMLTLALYHQRLGQLEQMHSYFNLAEEHGEIEVFTHKGEYYKAIGDFDAMKNSFMKGIESGSMDSAQRMAEYYKETGDIANMDKFYSIPLDYWNEEQMLAIIESFGSENEKYQQKYAEKGAEKGYGSSMLYLGVQAMKKGDHGKMVEYYKKAADKGQVSALIGLGWHYALTLVDLEKAKLYFSMAVEKGEVSAMWALGEVYARQMDFNNMEKYYKMVLESADINNARHIEIAMQALNQLCMEFEKRNEIATAKKYCLFAIERDINGRLGASAMFHLGRFSSLGKDYPNMIKYYEMAIERGEISSMVSLGNYYSTIDKDLPKANALLLKAAEKGQPIAMRLLGTNYAALGDPELELKYYHMAAERGDHESLFKIGLHYAARKNSEKMEEYYKKAVESGSLNGALALAANYHIAGDIPSMIKYYDIAAQKGEITAILQLAGHYRTVGDTENMKKYLELAADQGDQESFLALVNYYATITDNVAKKKAFLAAIERGNVTAFGLFALHLFEVEKDTKAAEIYAKQGAEKGDVLSFRVLGGLYDSTNQPELFVKYVSKGIQLGDAICMLQMGMHYYKLQDEQNMLKFMGMAVERGHPPAMKFLGDFFGLKKEFLKSKQYLEMAMEAGDTSAYLSLGYLAKQEKDIESTEKYYRLAGEHGDPTAFVALGKHYVGINQLDNAIKCFTLAADQGNSQAMLELSIIFRKSGNTSKMLEYLEKAIKKNDRFAVIEMAIYYNSIAQPDKALAVLKLLENIPGDKRVAAILIGKAYCELQDYAAAVKYFHNANNMKEDAESLGLLAVVYSKVGDHENSTKYLKKASEAGHIKAPIELALNYISTSDWENALKYSLLAHKTTAGTPHFPLACRLLGQVYYATNDIENMKKYFNIAIELGDTKAAGCLGDYYSQIGDWDNTVKYCSVAAENGEIACFMPLAAAYKFKNELHSMLKCLIRLLEHDEVGIRAFAARGINQELWTLRSPPFWNYFTDCQSILDDTNSQFLEEISAKKQ